MYGYIYKFTFLPTDEFYVGKHKYNKETLDESYWGSGKKWTKLLSQYDKSTWKDLILREIVDWAVSEDDLNEKERFWIEELNARSDGLNISVGGQNPILFGDANGFFGKSHTEETKQIIGDKSRKWQQDHPGYSYSKLREWQLANPEEYSKAQSKASKHQLGHKKSSDCKLHISQKRIKYYVNGGVGVYRGETKHTNKSLAKISESLTGHEVSQESRDKVSKFVSDSTNITNGLTNLRCDKNNISYYEGLGLGYHKGNTSGLKCKSDKINYTTITNGYINHHVHNSELEVWYKFGWIVGNYRNKSSLVKLGLLEV